MILENRNDFVQKFSRLILEFSIDLSNNNLYDLDNLKICGEPFSDFTVDLIHFV